MNGIAIVKHQLDRLGRPSVSCQCRWSYAHKRPKVREAAAWRHIDKRHRGRGVVL